MQILKKDGTTEEYNGDKIRSAIDKAAERCNVKVDTATKDAVVRLVNEHLKDKEVITTYEIHPTIIQYLKKLGCEQVADSYQSYRDYKNSYAKAWAKIRQSADEIIYLGDKENANFDSSLISTKGSLIKGALAKELYTQFYLSNREKELCKAGDIYIHDLRDMILGCFNCCLFDIETVLKGGFTMSNVHYTEPTSVLSALQVIGDITLVATAQQFGGFTLAELDRVLIPYAEKTFKTSKERYLNMGVRPADAEYRAHEDVLKELRQGFQSLELKLNTVPCSRGDFAFTTITFGFTKASTKLSEHERMHQFDIIDAILKTRREGHGGKPVVFPKLVFLHDKNIINTDMYAEQAYEQAIRCTAQCMYPDYLSLTGARTYNKVAQVYSCDGTVNSPMGCRAYLTPWVNPTTGKHATIGRCNIGAVSLNLPIIAYRAIKANPKDPYSEFYKLLDDRLEVIRTFLKKRYAMMREVKASTNPMCFTQGGLLNGTLKPDDKVGDLVEYMTASFGVTALNETTQILEGQSIRENQTVADSILSYLNDKIEAFKLEDGHMYALYGTPAESLCQTQAKQFKELTGYSLGEYFTNSFHMHVSEDINPFEKQDLEFGLFHKCNGGHIQYIRIDNPDNISALVTMVNRGMDMGFYQGINFDSVYCQDCGEHSNNTLRGCPHCGSKNLTVISRVCGYLGYTQVNGATRMNDGKLAEIHDRVSM